MENLIKMREEALEYRKKAEEEMLQKMFEDNELSTSTYNSRRIKLTKWVDKEKLQISKLKKDMVKGFTSTSQTIKRTQRDINYMRKMFSEMGIKENSTIHKAQFKFFG